MHDEHPKEVVLVYKKVAEINNLTNALFNLAQTICHKASENLDRDKDLILYAKKVFQMKGITPDLCYIDRFELLKDIFKEIEGDKDVIEE